MENISWVDKSEYPFGNKYIQMDDGRMHYIDEGTGEVILLVHGIPDWSFGWRHIIKQLSIQYRCIAVDHLGFGLSDKPADADLSLKAHAARLTAFIDRLQLRNIHLVVHDFGGPIGLAYAVEHPENIKNITAINTWMWPLNGTPHFEQGAKVVNSWLGKLLYLKANFSVRFMLKNSYADKTKLTAGAYNHYLMAQKEPGARLATYRLAQALTGEITHMEYLYSNRRRLANVPVYIAWGMKDKFVPAALLLPKWKEVLPNAHVAEIAGAGHFVQEEAPGLLIKILGQNAILAQPAHTSA